MATFKKPLVAGVSGRVQGIGVTILPIFDLVLAAYDTTFETAYAKIGQIPEGATILNLTTKLNQNVVR